ncbi:MAG: putative 4-hydroxybenzoate polyprenyltransferase [Nitrospirae bacterium]|nr:putative 4-hydroxybenzoate polyprenyltransferase [Nitrospirota bacterium]
MKGQDRLEQKRIVPPVLRNLGEKAVLYLRMIKFSHSVFALPFALTSALIAAQGIPEGRILFWIVIAMVSARSTAMGLNRIIDRKIDKENPRTAAREIPAGRIKVSETLLFVGIAVAAFLLSAHMLNPLCFKLSGVALFFVFLYSFTKRFTWASHFVLGVTISGAPLGAWIAVTGGFDARIALLGLAIVFWLAGFDILYAFQDVEFDRRYGLYSLPARFGIAKALRISRACHLTTWVLFLMTGILFAVTFPFYVGLGIAALLLLYEHSLVKPGDLRRLNKAFFDMNGYISVTVFFFTLLSYLLPV